MPNVVSSFSAGQEVADRTVGGAYTTKLTITGETFSIIKVYSPIPAKWQCKLSDNYYILDFHVVSEYQWESPFSNRDLHKCRLSSLNIHRCILTDLNFANIITEPPF